MLAGAVAACVAALSGCAEPGRAGPPGSDAAPKEAAADADGAIGVATMEADGTLVLRLRAEDGAGTVGDGELRYAPGHRDYQAVLGHVGALEPGASRPVLPWP